MQRAKLLGSVRGEQVSEAQPATAKERERERARQHEREGEMWACSRLAELRAENTRVLSS